MIDLNELIRLKEEYLESIPDYLTCALHAESELGHFLKWLEGKQLNSNDSTNIQKWRDLNPGEQPQEGDRFFYANEYFKVRCKTIDKSDPKITIMSQSYPFQRLVKTTTEIKNNE